MKNISLFISLLLVVLASTGQEKFQKMIDRDNGSNSVLAEYGHDIKQTSDGGFVVVGYSNNYGIGNDDVFVVKLDMYGDTIWSRIFGTIQAERGLKIVTTSDGGVAVGGYTEGAGAGGKDVFLLKIDSVGAMQWSKTFGSARDEAFYNLEETADNGFVLVAESEFQDGSFWSKDALVIKTDANGDTLWTKRYGDYSNGSDVVAKAITQTNDGGYMLTGVDAAFGGGFFLLKLDNLGDTVWSKSYSGTGVWPEGRSIKQTADGGFLIGASTFTGGFGAADWVLIKTDAQGIIEWSRVYGSQGSSNGDYFINATPTADGGYAMGGILDNNSVSSLSLIKTNSLGVVEWSKSFANQYGSYQGYSGYYGMIACADNGYALIAEMSNQFGNTIDGLYNGSDIFVVKTDENGNSVGCVQNPISVLEQSIALNSNNAPFEKSGGITLNSGVFLEQNTTLNVTDAGIQMFLYTVDNLCGETCSGEVIVNPCDSNGFYCSGSAPYTYVWNDFDSQITNTATGLCVGVYTVTITDSYGCTGVDSVSLFTAAPEQAICFVTVDSTSTYNLVVWEKPNTTGIDSFKVYRLVAGGGYTWVGSVAYDSLSQFKDITNGVNPNVTSYRYKTSTLDTCGNESALSDFHETINLAVSGNTLTWDNYEGNIGSFYYRILRDTSGLEQWEVIDSVTDVNFLYTDINPIPNVLNYYMIEVLLPFTCTPAKAVGFKSSRSNRPNSIAEVLPNAEFNADNLSINENGVVNFLDQSQGTPSEWKWYFEGGIPAVSTDQNPQVAYLNTGCFYAALKVTNNFGSDSIYKDCYINVGAVGIFEKSFDELFSIFPNPNNGTFTINSLSQEKAYLEVYNLTGQVVFSEILIPNKLNKIELNNSGIYQLKITRNGFISTKTIIVEK